MARKKKLINQVRAKVAKQTIKYYLNDPTTPDLVETVTFTPSKLFNVVGYTAPNENFTTTGGLASNVNGVLNFAMNNFYNSYSLDNGSYFVGYPYVLGEKKFYKLVLGLESNYCVSCGVDMGPSNPRQYCRKTYCPYDKN